MSTISLLADGTIAVDGTKVWDVWGDPYAVRSRGTNLNLRVGEKAWYRGGFGGEARQRCTITGIDEKDGEKVYDCTLENGDERWGYDNQFSR